MTRVAACLLVVAVAAGCRPEGVTLVSEAELPADVYGSPRPTPSPPAQQIPEEGTIFVVKDSRLRSQTASLPDVDSLQEALLFALIAEQPAGRNVTTEIPPRTRLIEVEVEGTVATVNLSSEFETGSGQSLALRIAQVVYTLTEQPSGIIGVRLEIDGVPAPVVDPDRPANRGDYREFAPQGSA